MSDAITVVAQSGLDAKREAALATLGPNWIGHPDYRFNPRHSNNPDIHQPARAVYLLGIAQRAAKARATNPAFIRAEQVRQVLGGA